MPEHPSVTTDARLPAGPELRALFALRSAPGIGDIRLRERLRDASGSASRALARLLRERPDVGAVIESPAARSRIEHAATTVERFSDIRVLLIDRTAYPARLLHLADPPPLLFTRGDTTLLDAPAVGIVGTRAATEYGADVARMIATACAAAGVVVISGLAHGIDRHAHEAALEAGGPTIGVIGSGIDVAYPPQHAALQARIAERGLIVTEFLPGQPALAHHFPRRNRIIAALSAAVVVVEAPVRSGALITAAQALELGREVMAVPGPIGRRTSEGTNALLRDGAAMILDPRDVPETVASIRAATGWGRVDQVAVGSATVEAERVGDRVDAISDPLIAGLGDEPVHAEEIARRSGSSVSLTLARLLELELAGRVRQLPGLRFATAQPGRNRDRHRV